MPDERLKDWVWSDRGSFDGKFKSKLQVAIKRLNDDLAELTGDPTPRVVRADNGYRIVVAEHELDVFGFDRWRRKASEALRAGQHDYAVRFAQAALDRWRGQALGDLADETFAVRRSQQLETQRLATQWDLAQALQHTGALEEAVSVARILVDCEPDNEAWRLLLVRAIYGCGRHAEALTEWRSYLAILEERGLEPAAEAQLIETAILNRDPSLPEGVHEEHPPTGPKTYLFIGSETSPAGASAEPEEEVVRDYEIEVQAIVDKHRGFVFDRAGRGFCTMFEDPVAAVLVARDLGLALRGAAATPGSLRVTMAVHTGTLRTPDPASDDPTIVHVARLRDACHPGQVLVSTATRELVADGLPLGVVLRPIGHWQFDASDRAEAVYQVVYEEPETAFPPLRTGSHRTGRPPHYTTAFFGREQEQAELAGRLQPGQVVTLMGPGGVGKTRLALEVAHRMTAEECPDDVWYCDVSLADDADTLVDRVAAALGLVLTGGGSHRFEVVQRLATARLLLVLDGCEHLRSEVASLVGEVLNTGGPARVLVTSRARLEVAGEQVVVLAPLSVPAAGDPEAARAPAVELLVDRARAAGTWADPDDDSVAELARRLEGLPLAIELAATQLTAFPASKLVERFDEAFAARDGGPLRATFEGSFDLVSPAGQRLLTALSVFRGTWSLEGAEAVAAAVDVDPERVMVLMAELVSVSLVRVEMPAGGGPARYRMLDMIRAYAAVHLVDSGRAGAVAAVHAEYFLDLAEQAVPHRRGADETVWVGELVAEFDNLRAAYRAFKHSDRPLDGLRLAVALAPDLIVRERIEIGRWASDLTVVPAVATAPELVHALGLAANAAMVEDRLQEATDLAWEAIRVEKATSGAPPAWMAHNVLAMTTLVPEVDSAQETTSWKDHIHAMEEHSEALHDPFPRALALWNRAFLAWWTGEDDLTADAAQQLLDLGSCDHNSTIRSLGLMVLGRAALLRHDPERARDAFRQALGLAEASRTTLVVNLATRALADLGDHREALVTLTRLASSFVQSGNQAELAQTAFSIVDHLVALGWAVPAAGELVCLEDPLMATRPGFAELRDRVLNGLGPDERRAAQGAGGAAQRSKVVADLVRSVSELLSHDDEENAAP